MEENIHQEGEIPVREVIRDLDRLLERNRTEEAEQHLNRWLEEARRIGDWRARITILNELMGFHRSTGKEKDGLEAAEEGVRLVRDHGLENTVTGGTTFLNGATTRKAFGKTGEAMDWYGQAERIYNRLLQPGDYRFAGLYNNLALAWTDLERYDLALDYYGRAMELMERLPGGGMELAVTWVNLACLYERREQDPEKKEEKIGACLEKAMERFDDPAQPRDGYYAFTCTKCAPTFGYFGYFLAERSLRERAEQIYGGRGNEGT